jgi:predicted MFS family arabinose efflux permease
VHLIGPGRRRVPALTVLLPFAAGYYVSYLFRTVNAVIAPELERELGLGPAELGLLTSTYFLTFAVAQIPVGVALDRYGPRRVVSLLLAIAALGAALFAAGRGFTALALGRGLIGLGVSACLMGGLKALAAAYPPERQTSLTGIIMAAGAFGALTASLPLAWLLPSIGWRGALAAVAGASLLVAGFIAVIVPRDVAPGAPAAPVRDQVRVFVAIARSPAFWRFAAQAGFFTGGFMAFQGLWAGPFLLVAGGESRAGAAATLFTLNLGMLAGQLAIGAGASRLARAGMGRERLMTTGLCLALVAQAVILLWPSVGRVVWFAFGFTSAAGAQVYGLAAGRFAEELSGRVSTAVNQFAFVGAFALQGGLGAVVELCGRWLPPADAFRATFAGMWVLQAAAVLLGRARPLPP